MDMDFKSVPRPPRPSTSETIPPANLKEPKPGPLQPIKTPKPSKRSTGLKWILIILLILLLSGGAYAWIWWQDKDKTTDSNQQATDTPTLEPQAETTPAVTCAANNKTYTNKDLGVGFCYPEAWGEPNIADAKLDPSDQGSRQLLSFAKKNEVKLGFVSADWSTSVGRGGACSDPRKDAPDFNDFSAEWKTESDGTAINFASRGVEKKDGVYIITEEASEFYGGVCLSGIVIINTATYPQATASYFKTFDDSITTPKAYIDNPTVLVTAADRSAFLDFVKSIKNL